MNQDEIERESYEARQKSLRDQKSFLNSASEEAWHKAWQEGYVEGHQLAVETLLDANFGEDGRKLLAEVGTISDVARLQTILVKVSRAKSLEEVRNAIQSSK
jgi:hypothetical protein